MFSKTRGLKPHRSFYCIVFISLVIFSPSAGSENKAVWHCASDQAHSKHFQMTLSLKEWKDSKDFGQNQWLGEIQAKGFKDFPITPLVVNVNDKPVKKLIEGKNALSLPGRELSVHILKSGNGKNWDGFQDRPEDLYLTAYLEVTFFQGYPKGQGLLIYEVGYGEKDRLLEAIALECQ